DAALSGQSDVQHDHVDLQPVSELLQCFFGRPGLTHDLQVLLLREHLAHAGTQDRVIVDDQHTNRCLLRRNVIAPLVLSYVQHYSGTSVSSPRIPVTWMSSSTGRPSSITTPCAR